ncbi:hypothetical protein N9195_02250 [bacterium]|nr:hypothetical protein [bacterium]
MKRFLLLLIALFVPVSGVPGQTPLKPANGIYDPEGWLDESEGREMEVKIAAAREKGGAAVFVAILPKDAVAEGNEAALLMGKSWGGGGLWGLLLHVIDDPESPRYFGEFGGAANWSEQQRNDFEASIQRALSEASRKAKLSADPQSQVASGTRILSEEFGYLGLVMEKIEHNNARARGDRVSESSLAADAESGPSFGVSTVFLAVIGLLIVISVFFFFRLKNEEEREMEYHFPETSPRKRFLGPWSGGGNVLMQFNVTNEGGGRESERRF